MKCLINLLADDAVVIPSELFSFASDPILLMNVEKEKCLSEDLSPVKCTSPVAVKWVYLFNGGELFTIQSSGMQCLSVLDDNATVLSGCNSLDDAVSARQRWDYDELAGTLKSRFSGLCLSMSFANATLDQCDAIQARWSGPWNLTAESEATESGALGDSLLFTAHSTRSLLQLNSTTSPETAQTFEDFLLTAEGERSRQLVRESDNLLDAIDGALPLVRRAAAAADQISSSLNLVSLIVRLKTSTRHVVQLT